MKRKTWHPWSKWVDTSKRRRTVNEMLAREVGHEPIEAKVAELRDLPTTARPTQENFAAELRR